MNHPILDQLRREGAALAPDRLEQLVALAALCLEARDVQQTMRNMGQDYRILSKAIFRDESLYGLSPENQIEYGNALAGMENLVDAWDDEYALSLKRLSAAMDAAGIATWAADPLERLAHIFAQTGDYKAWNFRVSVDAAGVIQVEKRESRTIEERVITFDVPDAFWESIRLAGASFEEAARSMRSLDMFTSSFLVEGGGMERFSWRDRIEQSQGRNGLFDINGGGSGFGSALEANQLLRDTLVNPRYQHHVIPVGEDTKYRPIFPSDRAERPKNLDKAKEVTFRHGTAWMDKKGKILFIDWH